MAIILQEALRGLFYAPFYVALARDAFAGEGVEIRFTSSPHPNETALRVTAVRLTPRWAGSADRSASTAASPWAGACPQPAA